MTDSGGRARMTRAVAQTVPSSRRSSDSASARRCDRRRTRPTTLRGVSVGVGQRTVTLKTRHDVVVTRAKHPFRMISIVERSFFQTLRAKFRWGGSVPLVEEDTRSADASDDP